MTLKLQNDLDVELERSLKKKEIKKIKEEEERE